jgi:tetratricopeptide (TPR) repeat protein
MKRRIMFQLVLAAMGALALAQAQAAPIDDAISDVAHQWAKANYETPDGNKTAAFEAVIANARQVASSYPNRAEPLVWEAIALSSAAKSQGGFGALHKAREARDLLLSAEAIDPGVINGAVYTSLGSLYANVPGWPIGFGDKKKARDYLEKAIAIAPNDIDSNYFYADFLSSQGDYADAASYAKRALAAPPRPGREDADAGRRQEAQTLLATLRTKHADKIAGS